MGPVAYEAARDTLVAQSALWTWLLGVLAVASAASAIASLVAGEGRRLPAPVAVRALVDARWRLASALAVALWAGWARLGYFHLEIRRAVRVPDIAAWARSMADGASPAAAAAAAAGDGLAAPLWIEGEKLYAWACLLALGLLALWRRRDDPLAAWVLVLLAGLTLAAIGLTNPFTDPLPGLHQEVGRFHQALGSGDPQLAARALESMWARKTFFYNTAYMWTHPPALFISYAAFAVAFIAAVLLLLTRAVRYDRLSYDYAKFGYLVLTAGMLIGYPWAVTAWRDDPWWWSGKVNMSLMMWVLYSGYLHARLYLNRRGMWRFAGWLGVGCFVTLVLTYLSTYLVPGAHSVAQP